MAWSAFTTGLVAGVVLYTAAAEAKNCKKGCPCGDSCIPCNHTCHVGSAPSSYSPPAPSTPVRTAAEPISAPIDKPLARTTTAKSSKVPLPPPTATPSAPQPEPIPPLVEAITPQPPPTPAHEPRPSEEDDSSPLILGVLSLLGVIGGAGYYFGVATPRRRQREAEDQARREREYREQDEARAAPALAAIDIPDLHILGRVNALVDEFDTLRTFGDVARWDAAASEVAGAIEGMCSPLAARVAEVSSDVAAYRLNNKDPSHISRSRITKTEQILANARATMDELTGVYEALGERVDMTPDNAKEQRAVLKELRAQKKELNAQKREARAAMTSIRREARELNTAATPGAWSTTWDRKNAADERRAIRRAKEAALGPHEDEVAALERQILSVDRRIAWVQRFGDDEAAAD